jgi:hypothetical protein
MDNLKRQELLDYFGAFLMDRLRDRGIEFCDLLLAAHWRAPALQPLQEAVSTLPEAQKDLLKRVVRCSIDTAIHDFLFALQEHADFENRIHVLVDEANVVALSDGIHGELFMEDGWYARFSRFGSSPEKP